MTQAEAAAPALTTPAKQPRVFYGWYIVLGAIIAQFVAVGIQAGVSGVFLRPMTEDLGWTRAQFTIATSLGTGVSGLIGFFIGSYVDRVGARPLMVVGVTIVGATLLAISRVEELWQFVLLRGLAFTVGFVLIGNLVVNVTVSKWFVERRGWAISLASLGVSAAGIAMPLTMVRIVDTLGWRDGWVVMGLGAWALIYPVALIMRRQPEDQGLLPDGRVEGRAGDEAAVERSRLDFVNSYTRGEAVRTLAMWLLVFAFGFAMVGLISLLFHSIPFLTDNGFTRTDASIIAASQGASALLSKFAWGWAMQRFHPRALAASSFLLSGLAVLSMVPIAASGSVPLMFAAFIVWGWGIGGMIPLSEFIWASFYGRRYLGAVRSAGMPLTILFGAGGPYFAGAYFDAVGSYDGALIAFASLWFVATLLILFARQPKSKVTVDGAPVSPDDPAASFEAGAQLETAEPDGDVPAPSPRATGVEAEPEPAVAVPGREYAPSPRRVEREPEPPPREPMEVFSVMNEMDQPTRELEAHAPAPRPRDYMSDEDGRQPVRDYMHQQIDAPREAGTNGANGANRAASNGGEADSAGQAESEYGFTEFEEIEGGEDRPPDETAAAEEPAPAAQPSDQFEPRRRYQPPPAWRPSRPSRPSLPSLPSLPGSGLRPAAGVNLGEAGRALQRRIPAALAYYRRDGVSSAVWAGVATSVAVTAAVWLLSRNGK